MLNLEQLLGLYLSIACMTLAVVCFHLWRRRRWLVSAALALAPIGVWTLWSASRMLPEFHRYQLGIGLLPLLPALLVVPFAWLYSLDGSSARTSLVDRLIAKVPRLLVGSPTSRAVLSLVSVAGIAWFAYGCFGLRGGCDYAALSRGELEFSRAALCVSSAAGLWPLLVALTLLAIVAVSKTAASTSR